LIASDGIRSSGMMIACSMSDVFPLTDGVSSPLTVRMIASPSAPIQRATMREFGAVT
jgi:hypothetical protein